MTQDKRLIEHYIPIKQISAEASREKSIRHGHISTLHLWWARRPLVASRAAVFASLVPAPTTVEEEIELNQLMIDLCKWELAPSVLEKARQKIRQAYPDAPPKVLDMFAGGGSIPLEALRLGCEAYALDLNPVAHIIELATLVYPQKYGKQLAEDVKKWGDWVLERVRAEVGDLYPLIPDPSFSSEDVAEHAVEVKGRLKQQRMFPSEQPEQLEMDFAEDEEEEAEDALDGTSTDVPFGYLQPVAYLWTRTVTCPNPSCRASVPLVRQTWLKKKKNDNVALEMLPHPTEKRMAFYLRHARDPQEFGFDPAGFSQRGNSVCGCCGTTVTSDYVKEEGQAGRMSTQMMAIVCVRPNTRGKIYLSPDDHNLPLPDETAIQSRIEILSKESDITAPEELLPANDQRNFWTIQYGLTRYKDLFNWRQLLTLLTFVKYVQAAHAEMSDLDEDYAKAVTTYLGLLLGRSVNYMSSLCVWAVTGEFVVQTYGRQALPMTWDFAETQCLASSSGSFVNNQHWIELVLANLFVTDIPAHVQRGSATSLPFETNSMDIVITDPPYYDYISYSDLSDFFYVWFRRIFANLHTQHFVSELAPKKNEAIMAPYRHENKQEARDFYEKTMQNAFIEAHRVLKVGGEMIIVYAHKTTAGWSTLVDALRKAQFSIVEAWPLDTERPTGLKVNTAALASSFFLVARKYNPPIFTLDKSTSDSGHIFAETGDYINDVQPEMQRIVGERVRFFLAQGITGADLNIAAVGAGLAPFTRYARVELPNGEELTSAAYLDEVQAEVVRALLGESSKTDNATQYYIMGRDYYAEAWVDFDEANNLARATGVELDSGTAALMRGKAALLEKKGAKVRLRDYSERGDSSSLGLPSPEAPKAAMIDVLHRLLWLVENDNSKINDFMAEAMPDKYLLRLTAQTLGGKALASEPTPGAVRDERTREQRAIDTLLASWRRVVDEGKML